MTASHDATVALAMSAAAATMLLSGFKWVRHIAALRFGSFYLAPLAATAMILTDTKDAWELYDEIHILFAPFFVWLTVGYVWFSRKIKNEKT